MKVLITGGAGFIGSHVADAYVNAGHEVIIVDNLSTGSTKNIPKKAKFYLLDIGAQELDKVFELEKPEIVDHHAAQISVTVSTRDPIQDAKINALGLLNLLETSVRHSIKKFIFISTGGAIYGDTEIMPTPEDHPSQPISPYGIHKYLGEQYLRFYAEQHGLKYTVLRYSNVYGPRQNPLGEAGVVSIFINSLLGERLLRYFPTPKSRTGCCGTTYMWKTLPGQIFKPRTRGSGSSSISVQALPPRPGRCTEKSAPCSRTRPSLSGQMPDPGIFAAAV